MPIITVFLIILFSVLVSRAPVYCLLDLPKKDSEQLGPTIRGVAIETTLWRALKLRTASPVKFRIVPTFFMSYDIRG